MDVGLVIDAIMESDKLELVDGYKVWQKVNLERIINNILGVPYNKTKYTHI